MSTDAYRPPRQVKKVILDKLKNVSTLVQRDIFHA